MKRNITQLNPAFRECQSKKKYQMHVSNVASSIFHKDKAPIELFLFEAFK
jgi:hypothetical protein